MSDPDAELTQKVVTGAAVLLVIFVLSFNSIARLFPEQDVRKLTRGEDIVNACAPSTPIVSPFDPSSLTQVEGIVKGKVLAIVPPGDGTVEALLETYNPADPSKPCLVQVTISRIARLRKGNWFIAHKRVNGIDVDSFQVISENQYEQIRGQSDPEEGT